MRHIIPSSVNMYTQFEAFSHLYRKLVDQHIVENMFKGKLLKAMECIQKINAREIMQIYLAVTIVLYIFLCSFKIKFKIFQNMVFKSLSLLSYDGNYVSLHKKYQHVFYKMSGSIKNWHSWEVKIENKQTNLFFSIYRKRNIITAKINF